MDELRGAGVWGSSRGPSSLVLAQITLSTLDGGCPSPFLVDDIQPLTGYTLPNPGSLLCVSQRLLFVYNACQPLRIFTLHNLPTNQKGPNSSRRQMVLI